MKEQRLIKGLEYILIISLAILILIITFVGYHRAGNLTGYSFFGDLFNRIMGIPTLETQNWETAYVVCEGDSITAGVGANPRETENYVAQLAAMLPNTTFDNIGLSGDQIANNINGSDTINHLAAHSEYDKRTVVFMMGHNDIATNGQVSDIEHNIDLWIAAVRAADPSVKIVGMTLHAIYYGTYHDTFEPRRQAVNTYIRSTANFDYIVDLAADSRLSNFNDTTYYDPDKVHLNNMGYSVIADLVKTVLVNNARTGDLSAGCTSGYANNISQYNITWYFDKCYRAGKFVNGDYWVVGPVNITMIDPAFRDGQNGSMVDPVVYQHGFDNRTPYFNESTVVIAPVLLYPNTSLITAISNGNVTYVYYLKTAAVLTVLDSIPPTDAFRPSYVKGSKKIYELGDVNLEILPDLIPYGDEPNITEYAQNFQRVWIDHLPSIGGTYRYIRPVDNLPDYSRDSAALVQTAALLLLVNNSESKIPLLVNFLQLGIDQYDIYKQDNNIWLGGSGQGNGHKWPILFAGIMFNDPGMMHLGPIGEDDQVYWYNDSRLPAIDANGWPKFGVKSWTGSEVLFGQFPEHDASFLSGDAEHVNPRNWSQVGRTAGNLDGCGNEGYRICCTSSVWVGQALAAQILGAKSLWNDSAFFAYVGRWMTENYTPEQLADLGNATCSDGVAYPQDMRPKDYYGNVLNNPRNDRPTNFVNRMWDAYANETALPIYGQCGVSNNDCIVGTLNDIADNSTHYLWQCFGINGGADASCSLAIPSNLDNTNNLGGTGGGGGGRTTATNATNASGTAGTAGGTEQGGQTEGQPTEATGSQGNGNTGKISSSTIVTYMAIFLAIAIVAVVIALIIVVRRARAARLKKEMFDRAAANFSNLTNQEPSG